ncbi:MAG: alpha/beta hydrolase [Vicinamibacteria bacterium]|nr:alpha/beta hydrolase [Vicinamibacteria bacterium]
MELPQNPITSKKAVLRLPGMDEVRVLRDLPWPSGDGGDLALDVYLPADLEAGEQRPAVILVLGYPDPGMERLFGRRFKDWGSSTSWARLLAVGGLIGVAYTNRKPEADLHQLLRHLREGGSGLGIDPRRIGLLACSGHGPLALSALIDDRGEPSLQCAVLLYPYTLDEAGFTATAAAAATFRFANPSEGKRTADLPGNIPILLVRAGGDAMPGLNETLDRFAARAVELGRPVSVVHHPGGPHAFDLDDDSEPSRDAIRSALEFFSKNLLNRKSGPGAVAG